MKNCEIYFEEKVEIDKKDINSVIKYLKDYYKFIINSLTITFLSKEMIKEVNKKFLKHDYVTDIITFNYSDNLKEVDAEILICPSEALRNSKKYKTLIKDELVRLVVHGILHIMGYDDKTINQKKEMRKIENYHLRQISMK